MKNKEEKRGYKKIKYINWKEIFISIFILIVLLNFWNSRLVQPLRMFVVFNHEVSHGLASIITGGRIVKLGMAASYYSEGGFAETIGGNKFLIFNAGYLGSILFGAVLLWVSKRERLAKLLLFLIAVYMIAISVLFVRTIDGMVYGVIFAIVLLLIVAIASKFISYILLRVLALSNCLLAIIDLIVDKGSGGLNDAVNLQQLTYIPAMFWWTIWIILAFFIIYKFFIVSFKTEEIY